MITTVTTTTVTSLAQAASFGAIAAVMLIVLLANKQFIATHASERMLRLSKAVNVVLVPLVLVFAMTAAVKLITALS